MFHSKFLSVILLALACYQSVCLAEQGKQAPQFQAHAHNDYRHRRPLWDALKNGFWSVEADIFLVDGELLVGHSRSELSRERTLRTLYLKPLKEYFKKHPLKTDEKSPPFTLLIDIKTDGEDVYPVLRNQLREYEGLLCTYQDGKMIRGPVQVVISGDRPKEMIEADNPRYAGIDGRLSDLNSDQPSDLMPLISDRWTSHFEYRGKGKMPEAEKVKLREIVKQAHAAGRRVRFWATPESEELWQELVNAEVDHINTDELEKLSAFLMRQTNERR
ncbi:phosphatidylinositol-specific phospholipase C/glycerophosphodiester phosphodiesterase family protein [uncultured Gimesia sp.]|uniref:phosphatidylinositol-specific phospholipase C/glycerophosphodiester phosphodiesterase family protein n=1 Tax=uncultured Gimesia sp. TaxID=1678688 RepID=UPI0030DC9DBD|tara:strand:+ start:213375 stop:214196 length:822 start_codon:yes stop_codon:yes gene_type:complete